MSGQDQIWTCSECGFGYVLDVEHRPVLDGEYTDVGHECPQCRTWFHSYYTNPDLDKKRSLLNRFYRNAHKSIAHGQRYHRKKEQFALSHNLLQARVKGLLQQVT